MYLQKYWFDLFIDFERHVSQSLFRFKTLHYFGMEQITQLAIQRDVYNSFMKLGQNLHS